MHDNPAAGAGILVAILGFYLVMILVFLTAVIIPFWVILKKAGFSPWLAIINVVPLGTLILLYVVAFSQWKVVPAPQPVYAGLPPYPQPPIPPQA